MNKFKTVALLILGWFFIFVGIIGLFLPFLQGILFIMIGLAILSSRSETVKRFLKHVEERHPQYHDRFTAWRKKIKGWLKKEDV